MRGNNNGTKLKNPDLRQKAYQEFCKWIAKGKSPRSFVFREGDLTCLGETIEEYMKANPTEFPPIHYKAAKSDGYAHWEQVVEDSAAGQNKEANTASLQMLMRNKFGWDKKEDTNESIDNAAIEKLGAFFKAISKTVASDKE